MARKRKRSKRRAPHYSMVPRRSGRIRRRHGGGGGRYDVMSELKQGALNGLYVALGAVAAKLGIGYFSVDRDPTTGIIQEKASVSPLVLAAGALAPGLGVGYYDRDKGKLIMAGGVAAVLVEALFPEVTERMAASSSQAAQMSAAGAQRAISLSDFGFGSANDFFVYGDGLGVPENFAIGAAEDFAIGSPLAAFNGLADQFQY